MDELFEELIDNILQKIENNIIRKETVQDDGNSQRVRLGG